MSYSIKNVFTGNIQADGLFWAKGETKTKVTNVGPQIKAHVKAGRLVSTPALADTDVVESPNNANSGKVSVAMQDGGNLSIQTAANGTGYTAFPSKACSQLTIINDSGQKLEAQQGGSGEVIPIFDQNTFTFFGISNANQIAVRRKDTTATPVTVNARWEV